MKPLTPLVEATAVEKRANYVQEIVAADFGAAASSGVSSLGHVTLANINSIELSHIELTEPFQDTTDAAQNSLSLVIGDSGTANRHLTATELNANGSYVPLAMGTATKYVPTSDTTTVYAFTGVSGKLLSHLNKGKLLAFWRTIDARQK